MFKRIVVPLDGTPSSEAALAPARELARLFAAHLLLVRAVPPSGLPFTSGDLETERELERADEADAYLNEASTRLRAEGFDARLALAMAAPGAGVADAAAVDRADLIVMAAHPRWRTDVLDNSSTTLQVLARTRVPILAWRAPAPAPGGAMAARPAFLAAAENPILVPLDGSHFAEAALPIAEALAARLKSYLVLVRAVSEAGESDAPSPAEPREDVTAPPRDTSLYLAEAYLARIQKDSRRRGVGASAIAHRGAPVDVIARAARETNAGLVVMASHGTSGDPTRFMGSTAVQAIEELTLPVLVIQARAAS